MKTLKALTDLVKNHNNKYIGHYYIGICNCVLKYLYNIFCAKNILLNATNPFRILQNIVLKMVALESSTSVFVQGKAFGLWVFPYMGRLVSLTLIRW